VEDEKGAIVFTSNTSALGVVGGRFLENGNVVLVNGEGQTVWDSFDYPTDTFLPGLVVRYYALTFFFSFFRFLKEKLYASLGIFFLSMALGKLGGTAFQISQRIHNFFPGLVVCPSFTFFSFFVFLQEKLSVWECCSCH